MVTWCLSAGNGARLSESFLACEANPELGREAKEQALTSPLLQFLKEPSLELTTSKHLTTPKSPASETLLG